MLGNISNIGKRAVSCESGYWKFEKWKVKWKSVSLFSKSEMKIWFTLFEKWKVKWKSDSLFSRSEKWNENASRSRSRSEISREFSRIQNFLKILEKLTKTKKEESFQIQTIFLPTFSFWVHFGATSIFGKVFIWGGMVCDKCQMVPPTLLQWCNFMHISL